jgi:DNA-binding MarR family transcriptional regulator
MGSALGGELKQTRPFRSLEEEASLSIVRTAARFEHAFAQALKPYGITQTQYNVLRILRGAGANGLCRNEIGQRLVRQVPDVTRLLDRMEELGLIVRTRGGTDRRYVNTTISKKGLAAVNELDTVVDGKHREWLSHLDKRRLEQLIQLLEAVRHGA